MVADAPSHWELRPDKFVRLVRSGSISGAGGTELDTEGLQHPLTPTLDPPDPFLQVPGEDGVPKFPPPTGINPRLETAAGIIFPADS